MLPSQQLFEEFRKSLSVKSLMELNEMSFLIQREIIKYIETYSDTQNLNDISRKLQLISEEIKTRKILNLEAAA